MIKSPYFLIVITLLLYYLVGLILHFTLLTFQKEEWIQKIGYYLHIVLPHLFKVFFVSLLSGLLFIWLPTLMGIVPFSIFSRIFSFISSFSFAVMVSTIQGWLLIKGFEVIGKYHLPQKSGEMGEENQVNFVQPMVFFLGCILILSVILDLLLSFFILPLTT